MPASARQSGIIITAAANITSCKRTKNWLNNLSLPKCWCILLFRLTRNQYWICFVIKVQLSISTAFCWCKSSNIILREVNCKLGFKLHTSSSYLPGDNNSFKQHTLACHYNLVGRGTCQTSIFPQNLLLYSGNISFNLCNVTSKQQKYLIIFASVN